MGKFVGYTEYGVREAEYFNNDPGQLASMRAQKETYCTPNIDLWYRSVLTKSGECFCGIIGSSYKHHHTDASSTQLLPGPSAQFTVTLLKV